MTTPPDIDIGLSIYCRDPNWRDLGQNIDQALEAGVTSVELPLHALDLVAGGRIFPDRLRDVVGIVRGRGCRYTVHGHLGINLMDVPERYPLHRKVLAANIEISAALGAEHLVIHTGSVAIEDGARIGDAYARQREALHAAGDFARAAGLHICVENVFDFSGRRLTALPGELAREITAVAHPNVAATFDFSHGTLHSTVRQADFMAQAEALSPLSRHLHVHDSFGRPSAFWTYSTSEALAFGAGDLHLPVGWGEVPFDRIAETCRFPARMIANIELQARYWSELAACIAATRDFAARLRSHA